MSNFSKEDKINAFAQLGAFLLKPNDDFLMVLEQAHHQNAWFTYAEVAKAVNAMGRMLNKNDLQKWISSYHYNQLNSLKIGLVLAGNIPLVGLHDVLSVLASGHIALIKPSSQDSTLLHTVLDELLKIEPRFIQQIRWVSKLENFDAVIATGSNNTSRYFDYYFGKVPHIIRKNRHSIAVLSGGETSEQLQHLGRDIFSYFGLGCRNVSKIFVSKGYVFNHFFESIEVFNPIINHHKYNNNYDYNKSIFLVNKIQHLDNGFLLLTENNSLFSPLAVLYYETYQKISDVEKYLQEQEENIQVLVSDILLKTNIPMVGFGESQYPTLWDYADGVDTMKFLTSL